MERRFELRKREILKEADIQPQVANSMLKRLEQFAQPFIAAFGRREPKENARMYMCGHLRDLLPTLAGLPAEAFEAFTSPPVGNTSFLDGRCACPDKCLIGGTNANLWLEPAESIIAEIEKSLCELPHRRGLVVSSGGAMPTGTKPEVVKQVFDWLKDFKVN